MRLGLGISIPGTSGLVQAAFSPLDLSPVLWLDASDTSTITEVGGAVSQWDDLSGNGNDVTQGTAANQPTSGTRTINSLNVIDFDGSDVLKNVDFAATNTTVTFVVAQSDAGAGTSPYLFTGAGPSNIASYLSTTQYRIFQGTNVSGGTNNQNVNLWRVTFGTTDYLHINATQILSGNAGTAGWLDIFVGANPTVTVGWDGTIAEMIIVDGTLTAGQIADTEQYLADKWGITL